MAGQNVVTQEKGSEPLYTQESRAGPDGDNGSSNLCCCEYIDRNNRRHHLLGCLCNCEDLDAVFTQFITCRKLDPKRKRGMLLTFQDRLRIPWHGGAKQFSYESCLPLVLIPMVLCLAAINTYTCFIVLGTASLCVLYAYRHVRRNRQRSRFFCIWLFASVVYMSVIFQSAVPMFELLPEENLILVALSGVSLFFMWRTKHLSPSNQVEQSRVSRDDLPDFSEVSAAQEQEAAVEGNATDDAASVHTALLMDDMRDERVESKVCSACRKYMPPRTSHCALCSACFLRRDHHSYWLDCCIGLNNHVAYILAIVFGILALLLGADLTLTAICHPFLVVRFLGIPMMLPDDCSEVFDEFQFGVCFIVAVYAVMMSLVMLYTLLRQVFYISRGMTQYESKRGQTANRHTYLANWRSFLFDN